MTLYHDWTMWSSRYTGCKMDYLCKIYYLKRFFKVDIFIPILWMVKQRLRENKQLISD